MKTQSSEAQRFCADRTPQSHGFYGLLWEIGVLCLSMGRPLIGRRFGFPPRPPIINEHDRQLKPKHIGTSQIRKKSL